MLPQSKFWRKLPELDAKQIKESPKVLLQAATDPFPAAKKRRVQKCGASMDTPNEKETSV